MNNKSPVKLPALVVLIVMLLNPLMGLAESLWSGDLVHDAPPKDMSADMNEGCHEHKTVITASSEEASEPSAHECCEEPCSCSQSSCHSTLASLTCFGSSFEVSTQRFYSREMGYLSPALYSQHPPPII